LDNSNNQKKCNSPIGGVSNWNGMMLFNNILYTVSSENTIKYSEIPIYDEPNKYNRQLKEKLFIKKGEITNYEDKLANGFNYSLNFFEIIILILKIIFIFLL
jgi:hypothetical protein